MTRPTCLPILFLLVFLFAFIHAISAEDRLVQGFGNPPDESKLWAYWWWLNGNVTETAITRDLEQMKEKGFGGVVLFDADGSSQDRNQRVPAGPMYSSPAWTKLFLHAVKETDRLGLSISLNIQSGWNLGGPIVKPEHAAKRLIYSTTNVDGNKEISVDLPKPESKHDYYKDVAVVAFRSIESRDVLVRIRASSHQEDRLPQQALTASADQFWVSAGRQPGDGPSEKKPEWLELQFDHSVEFDRFDIMPHENYGPKKCELIVFDSDSGQGRTISTLAVKNAGITSVSFPKQKSSRFRLNILESYDPNHPEKTRNVQVANIALFDGSHQIAGSNQKTSTLDLFDIKLAIREFGGSAPDCSPVMRDEPDQSGDMVVPVEDVLILTGKMDEQGCLRWNAPEGNWTILRFGFAPTGARVSTSSGEWQGPVLDYLSREALDDYWEKAVKPLLDAAGDSCGRSLRYLHTDSWEAGGMNWTDDFHGEFKSRRGYDPLPYLPIIAGYILNDRNTSNRFLNDFRRTIGDLIAENHYHHMQKKTASYNLGIHPESGGPHGAPIDSLQLLGISDIPMSEYWSWSPRHRIGDANRFFTKQPASVAHTNSRKLVAAEGFTNIGLHWQESFSHNLKPSFDQAVCEGMNLLVWHAFICSPDEEGFPGQEYFAGTHFNPKNFVWHKSKDFLSYINRIQFLLQQGLPVADVLEYYGENVPNFTQGKGANTAKSLPGYDYDVASESVLLEQIVGVRDGKIVLKDGTNYRILVLPNRSSISAVALRKVEWLVNEGATVIGPKPKRATGLDPDPELKTIADRLWNKGSTLVRGRITPEKTSHELLQEDGVPFDFQRAKGSHKNPRIEWIHRTIYKNQLNALTFRTFSEFSPRDVRTVRADFDSGIEAEIYYVANLRDEPDQTVCAFRVVGRQPELWDPLTGEICEARSFTQTEKTTCVPLNFAPYGSIFVVFRKPIAHTVQGMEPSNEPTIDKTIELSASWKVRFDPRWGGPEEPIEFKKLESWTNHKDPAVQHFSGVAVYSQEIDIDLEKDRRVFLEFGNVCEFAEVKVNGQSCGTIWAAPFRLEITSSLKKGKNQLEIEVANHWANRVIGDAAKPRQERLTRTNIQRLTLEIPLVESGLIGQARLLYVNP